MSDMLARFCGSTSIILVSRSLTSSVRGTRAGNLNCPAHHSRPCLRVWVRVRVTPRECLPLRNAALQTRCCSCPFCNHRLLTNPSLPTIYFVCLLAHAISASPDTNRHVACSKACRARRAMWCRAHPAQRVFVPASAPLSRPALRRADHQTATHRHTRPCFAAL